MALPCLPNRGFLFMGTKHLGLPFLAGRANSPKNYSLATAKNGCFKRKLGRLEVQGQGTEGKGQARLSEVCDVPMLFLSQPRGFSSDLDVSRARSIPPTGPGSASPEPCGTGTGLGQHP